MSNIFKSIEVRQNFSDMLFIQFSITYNIIKLHIVSCSFQVDTSCTWLQMHPKFSFLIYLTMYNHNNIILLNKILFYNRKKDICSPRPFHHSLLLTLFLCGNDQCYAHGLKNFTIQGWGQIL